MLRIIEVRYGRRANVQLAPYQTMGTEMSLSVEVSEDEDGIAKLKELRELVRGLHREELRELHAQGPAALRGEDANQEESPAPTRRRVTK